MAYSGKNARVLIGTNTYLCAVKWTVDMRADELDVTCFNSAGQGRWKAGVHDQEITIEGLWETGIHDNPPGLVPGDYVTITLFVDFLNIVTQVYVFYDVLLLDVNVDAEVRGLVKYTIRGKARSTNSTLPVGNTLPTSEQS